MDNLEQFLQHQLNQNHDDQQVGLSFVYLASVAYLSVFLAMGSWCGVNLVSNLSSQGRILFTATLVLGLSAIVLVLRLFPRKIAIRLLLASLGLVFLGWVLYFMFKNYGVI